MFRATTAAACVVMVLAGCGSDPASAPREEQTTPVAEPVDGRYDVGGHSLYLRCIGTGSPTVLYLHPATTQPGVLAHLGGAAIADDLAPDYRTCVYDRRNIGNSDTVDEVQLPTDATADLAALLEAADVDPPYVLVGESLGGIIGYLYLNEHPDQVVAMVQLAAMFPDELSLDRLLRPDQTFEAFSEEEEALPERISALKLMTATQPFIGHEPPIPMTFLESETQGHDDNGFGSPEYDEQVVELLEAYVDRFSPGRLKYVDAPHLMDRAIPEEIAAEVRAVIAEID